MVGVMEPAFGPVWVVAEQSDGAILAVSLQLIGHARRLADELGTSVEAILLGHNLGDQAQLLIAAGADTAHLGDEPDLALYQPELYTDIIVRLASEQRPEIVLIGSKAATEGYPGSSGYCASKHGLLGLGRTLAAELGKYNINVNMINPGGFETNLRDHAIIARAESQGISLEEVMDQHSKGPGPGGGRLGKPEEIADLVVFLVTDQSKYIAGTAIDIDGGAG